MANNWTMADVERLQKKKQQSNGSTSQKRFQALEYFEAQKDKIFDEQLKVFAADGIAIIEQ